MNQFLVCISFLFVFGLMSVTVQAEEKAKEDFPSAAEVKIVKITRAGFQPSELRLTQNDASVFFFNDTGTSIDRFEIQFGKNRVHCHNPSLQLDDDGVIRSKLPLIPSSFAIACFPDSDRYPVRARINGKDMMGTVVVQ